MEDDESITMYNNTLKDMANESFSLGEPMSNEKLARKVLRMLPKKYAHKVTAIEEAQDLTTMSLDELIGNLATFEMSLNEGELSKKKGIALKATSENVDDEELGETINMLAKNFKKTLKRFNKKPFNGSVTSSITDRRNNRWKKPVKQGNYGTSQSDKPKDIMNDNSEDEKNMTDEEVLENYKLLYTTWMELRVVYTKVDAERNKLKTENEKLMKLGVDQDQEIHQLRAQVNAVNKGLKMMNSNTDILEEILGVRKDAGDST
ncbi:hypothetical protein LIER_03496 [Lithospermum erythrorhizon]|uniref:Gag-pol polyprotein n=1 Tax=Lithospermum erythrorhizon TaxID=34254 RepID=A0AAV3NTB5_LITER